MDIYDFVKETNGFSITKNDKKVRYDNISYRAFTTGTVLEIQINEFRTGLSNYNIDISTDQVTINTVEFSGTSEELLNEVGDTVLFLKANGTGGAVSGLLAPNSILGNFGDSIAASAYDTISTNARNYQDVGFITWAQIRSGSKYFQPLINNKTSVGGNTTAQMVARLGAAMAVKAKVVIIYGGINDPLTDANYTIDNLNKIYKAFVANGAIVIACTVMRADYVTGGKIVVLDAINAWIKTQASDQIKVADLAPLLTNIGTQLRDGTHPGPSLAYLMGGVVGDIMSKLIIDHDATAIYQADNSLNYNIALTGTTGNKDGGFATGSVAYLWRITCESPSVKPTITASKLVENRLESQVIELGGAVTGTNAEIKFYQNKTAGLAGLLGTDTFEGMVDFEILEPMININTIMMTLDVTTSESTMGVFSLIPIAQSNTPFEVGKRYQMRTPTWTKGGTAVTNIKSAFVIRLKDGTALPVAGKFRIHKITSRKVS